jgi:hypothetical protein
VSTSDVSEQLESLRATAEEHARRSKDSMIVTERLISFYRSLSLDSRPAANKKVVEWLKSGDEAKRYDAMALIAEFDIVDALDALRNYAAECEAAGDIASIRQWEKANRLIADLTRGKPRA